MRYYNDTHTIRFVGFWNIELFKLGRAHLYKLLHVFRLYFVLRLKVYGRRYRLYKRNRFRDIQYRFGFGHPVTVWIEGIAVHMCAKRRHRLMSHDYDYLQNKGREIVDWFPRGDYTEKGLGIENKPYLLRFGKVEK